MTRISSDTDRPRKRGREVKASARAEENPEPYLDLFRTRTGWPLELRSIHVLPDMLEHQEDPLRRRLSGLER